MEDRSVAVYTDSEESPLALIRHQLKAGADSEVIKSISEELEVDKELGLRKQAEITMERALQHDIDELTSSSDYFEVSKSLLMKLFQIRSLQLKCAWSNIKYFFSGILTSCLLPIFLDIAALATIYPMFQYSMWIWPLATSKPTPLLVTLAAFNIVAWIGWIVLLVFGFITWDGKKVKTTYLKVDLDMSPLSSVKAQIPYGAKLKVLEAKRTGIFTGFTYVTPKFEVYENLREIRFPRIDPAILGVTADNRMYMIVYWDIDKDVEKVTKEIQHFKKYKLHKT